MVLQWYYSGVPLCVLLSIGVVSEDVAVVHDEVEESGEAESEQVAPNNVPTKEDGEELQKEHFDDEAADATAKITDVTCAEVVQAAHGNPVSPDEEIGYGVVGHRGEDKRNGRSKNAFAGVTVQPKVCTNPQNSCVNGCPDQGGSGERSQTENGVGLIHSFFGSGSISAK